MQTDPLAFVEKYARYFCVYELAKTGMEHRDIGLIVRNVKTGKPLDPKTISTMNLRAKAMIKVAEAQIEKS